MALVLTTAWALGCASDVTQFGLTTTGTGGEGASGGQGGTAGSGGQSQCDEDCAAIPGIPICSQGVCNTHYDPPTCTIVSSPDGTECDDGAFCTLGDSCQGGTCVPGTTQNTCGQQGDQCHSAVCNETTDSCQLSPKPTGTMCTPASLCEMSGQCNAAGQCVGVLNDCLWTPVDDCHVAVCDPNDGVCKPQPANLGSACDADLCNLAGTCAVDGTCTGTSVKDCSYLDDINCLTGVCEIATGNCVTEQGQPGDPCSVGTDTCNDGICNGQLVCVAHPKPNGTQCTDYNSCTAGDHCTAGVCVGTPVANCSTYFEQNFDGACPPAGWTLNPDWQCGTPSVVGPAAAHSGTHCLGTIIDGNYTPNLSWASAYAQTPPFGLPNGSQPVASWFMWVDTEGYVYDGANLKVSTDGGATWQLVTGVSPVYTLTVGGENAWGGDLSANGWQLYTADLSAYANHQVMLRFAFHTDASGQFPGVYVDDLQVGEASAIPLDITTASLPNAVVGSPYSVGLTRTGGSANAQWSIVPGGLNHGWLSIDPATGVLSGTPAAGNAGPVSVTVHVQEPALPSNHDDQTYDFAVATALYFQSFDGVCPNGWTLTGEWQCGTPSVVGPGAAYSPPGCLGTVIAGTYSNGDLFSGNTATSGTIDLTAAASPELTWRAWVQTEPCCDGYHLEVSTDGGASWALVSGVSPTYNTTFESQSAWSGGSPTWAEYGADLTAYAGQYILLRFAFHSDSSVTAPGVYIDDVLITG
jgi:hypothetical protein